MRPRLQIKRVHLAGVYLPDNDAQCHKFRYAWSSASRLGEHSSNCASVRETDPSGSYPTSLTAELGIFLSCHVELRAKVANRAELDGKPDGGLVPRRTRINNTAIWGRCPARTLRHGEPGNRSQITSRGSVTGNNRATTVIGLVPEANRLRVYRMTATRLQRQSVRSVWNPNGFLRYTECAWRQPESHHFFGKGVVRFQPLSCGARVGPAWPDQHRYKQVQISTVQPS